MVRVRYIFFMGIFIVTLFTSICTRASTISADEYYHLCKQFSHSKPYEALNTALEAYSLYPTDERFKKEIINRSDTILSWSTGSQNAGNFNSAIYGYSKVKDISLLPNYMKSYAIRQILRAHNSKTATTLSEYYLLESAYPYSSPYEALTILNEAVYAFNDFNLKKDLNDRCDTIFSWSKGSQNRGNFDSAIYGYNTILNSLAVNDKLVSKAKKYLSYANQNIKFYTADEYYTLSQSFPHSSPYESLELLIDANKFYPEDTRFLSFMKNRIDTILSWSLGSHSNCHYSSAIYGYIKILNTPTLDLYFREYVTSQLNRALYNMQPYTLSEYINIAASYTTSNPYKTLDICFEGMIAYPNNKSFVSVLNQAADTILTWSIGSHSRESYEAAIFGYNKILEIPYISSDIIDLTNKYLKYATDNKKVYISSLDYYNSIHSMSIEKSKYALSLLTEALDFYPTDKNLNLENEERASYVLKESRNIHKSGNFEEAIAGYDSILSSLAPKYIVNEAKVCRLVALQKRYVVDKYHYKPEFVKVADDARNLYFKNHVSYPEGITYSSFGSYLKFEETMNYKPSSTFKFDSNGIPLVKYDDVFYYNPVTISQYALGQYGKYLNGEDTLSSFLSCANFLISMVTPDGSFRYPITYGHYDIFRPGWTSSMAQGQALSVFARAYHITKQSKYLDYGNKVLSYLLKPVSEGGVCDTLGGFDSSYEGYIFFQEYVTKTPTYTLNGYIFTLLGLYDWSRINDVSNLQQANLAKKYFNWGLTSLEIVLPYYDVGSITTYDLYYITKPTVPNGADFYHSVHIYELEALYSITNDKFLKDVRDLWVSYVK